MRRLLAVALLAALAACARDSESYADHQRPVVLMERFPSYATESEIARRFFPGRPLRTVVRENLARSKDIPQFTLVELTAAPYVDRGFNGGLMLQFLNDRLASVWFFTQDVDGYVAALRRSGVDVRTMRTVGDANPAIVAYTDHGGRRCVMWQDVRLAQQQMRWVDRYAK